MKRPKRPTESKPGNVFETGSSADRFDKDRPVLLLPGSEWSGQPELECARWWQKPTRRARCKQCAQYRVTKELDKDFHMMQLGQGGKCKACKGGTRTMNLKPQQPLIGMIFTNADLKICWQIRLQARQRHCCDDGKSYRCNRFRCGVGGRVNMMMIAFIITLGEIM